MHFNSSDLHLAWHLQSSTFLFHPGLRIDPRHSKLACRRVVSDGARLLLVDRVLLRACDESEKLAWERSILFARAPVGERGDDHRGKQRDQSDNDSHLDESETANSTA